MPDPSEIGIFLGTSHQCAMELMNNALYIQKEAPGITFPPGIAEQVLASCDGLVETKFDVVSAIHEIAEIASDDSNRSRIATRSAMVCRWLDEAILDLHRLVADLQDESEKDEQFRLGYFLLAESAVNILNARNAIPLPSELTEK